MASIGKRILLVDDDEQLVTLLSMKLSHLGYEVDCTTRADLGFRQALHNDYDVIILDMVMPRQSGLEICSSLRARGILTPVLILSGKTEKHTIIQGLSAGADDYLTKPFNYDELVARITSLVRRNKKSFNIQTLYRDGLKLDIPLSTVWLAQLSVSLTKKETLLLKRLMAEAPKPVPRGMLLQDVWGIGDMHASNRLDVYIGRLRRKLADLCGDDCIRTVRGGGYYFEKSNASLAIK